MVVWSNVIEQSPGIWENGNFISITGRVENRFGRTSLVIETASQYQLKAEGQTESEAEAAKNEPAPVVRAGFNEASEPRPVLNDPVRHAQPASKPESTGAQVNETSPTTYESPAQQIAEPTTEETPLTTESAAPAAIDNDDDLMESGAVLVRVKETGDAADDRYRLEDIMRLFAEFSGADPAILEIETGEKIIRLEMPFKVQSSSQLTERLHDLLGNGAVRSVVI